MAGQDKPEKENPKRPPFREVLPKKGLIFHESEPQPVLCKPKLLPLKSFTLEKLEKMQREATAKAQETILEIQRQKEEEERPAVTRSGDETATATHTHEPESVTFD